MQISKQKINKIQCNSILVLRGSQKGLSITCKNLTLKYYVTMQVFPSSKQKVLEVQFWKMRTVQ